MKKSIKTQHELNANTDQVWNLIKSGEKWETWFPILTGSRVENNTRYCELDGGDVLEERFLSSEPEKTFIYAVDKQQSFPATDIVGIIRLEEGENNTTRMFWSVEMQPNSEEVFPALEQQITEVYAASVLQLQELAQA